MVSSANFNQISRPGNPQKENKDSYSCFTKVEKGTFNKSSLFNLGLRFADAYADDDVDADAEADADADADADTDTDADTGAHADA